MLLKTWVFLRYRGVDMSLSGYRRGSGVFFKVTT